MVNKKKCESCQAIFADMTVVECEFCNGTSFTHISVEQPISEEFKTGLGTPFGVLVPGRSAAQHKEVVQNLVQNLSTTNKYAKAIRHGEFAAFSFVGTNDWEDYASLSISALNALSLANISKDLEAIRTLMEKEARKSKEG